MRFRFDAAWRVPVPIAATRVPSLGLSCRMMRTSSAPIPPLTLTVSAPSWYSSRMRRSASASPASYALFASAMNQVRRSRSKSSLAEVGVNTSCRYPIPEQPSSSSGEGVKSCDSDAAPCASSYVWRACSRASFAPRVCFGGRGSHQACNSGDATPSIRPVPRITCPPDVGNGPQRRQAGYENRRAEARGLRKFARMAANSSRLRRKALPSPSGFQPPW